MLNTKLEQTVYRIIGEHNGIDLQTIMQEARLYGQSAADIRNVIESGIRDGVIIRAPAIVEGGTAPDRFLIDEPPTAIFDD